MEIKRDKYLKMLQIRRHNSFVKVITGIRRCSKSYLMNDNKDAVMNYSYIFAYLNFFR